VEVLRELHGFFVFQHKGREQTSRPFFVKLKVLQNAGRRVGRGGHPDTPRDRDHENPPQADREEQES